MPPKSSNIFKAAANGDFLTVHAMLREGESAEAVDAEGWTAAGRAALRGRDGVIQVMLDHGLNPKLTGEMGISLLHVAALHNRLLVVRQLVAAGADPKAKTSEGKTPLELATDPDVRSALERAANGPAAPTPAPASDAAPAEDTNGAMDASPDAAGDAAAKTGAAADPAAAPAAAAPAAAPAAEATYLEGQQVFCRDRLGSYWPAIIKTVLPDGLFHVHFPGFGSRDDVTVGADSLLQVNLANTQALEKEYRRQHAAASAAASSASPAARGSKRKASAVAAAAMASPARGPGSANKRKRTDRADATDVMAAFEAIQSQVALARKTVKLALRNGGGGDGAARVSPAKASTVSSREQEATISALRQELEEAQAAAKAREDEAKRLRASAKRQQGDTSALKAEVTQLNKVVAKLKRSNASPEKSSGMDKQLSRLAQDKTALTQEAEKLKSELERKSAIIDRIGTEKLQLLEKIQALESAARRAAAN